MIINRAFTIFIINVIAITHTLCKPVFSIGNIISYKYILISLLHDNIARQKSGIKNITS